jgi:exodeoxyribonuclease V alpha subunit
MNLLTRLQPHGEGLRAVDIAFAETLRRLDPATDERVLLAAALASQAVANGHAALDPSQPQLLLGNDEDLPTAEQWIDSLQRSPWVSTPAAAQVADTAAPLVLENGLLYLRRYREYERALAAGLLRLAARSPRALDVDAVQPLFAELFPSARQGDRQARAAAVALVQSLLLVTGGPGTGKTTTIARLLLLLIAQADASGETLRIALAAPTGRAADRMTESVHAAVSKLGALASLQPRWIEALPQEARTLHRLLGSRPDSPQFRHHAGQPLPFDVIVVDEASMVDLPLMSKLVDAVADGARLILLGDRDQLPSVEAGDVLAAIGEAAGAGDALPHGLALTLARLLGGVDANETAADVDAPKQPSLFDAPVHAAPTTGNPVRPLAGHRVQLLRGYRQSAELELGALSAAIREGDADQALSLLRDGALGGVRFHERGEGPLSSSMRAPLLEHWRAMAAIEDPHAALQMADRIRLLTALREGPQGASTLNAQIEEALAGVNRDNYFHGRLLLVIENSYRHGLFNGDVGLCLRDGMGATVYFNGGSEGVRGFHPAALPAHTSAFALTVHKAQGSEFDQAWVVLPVHDARSLTRELLYTALTRARRQVHLFASEDILRATLARKAQRVSGLRERLR